MNRILIGVIIAHTFKLWLNQILPRLDTFSLNQAHKCLKHVDLEHCGDPYDWLKEPSARLIKLSEAEQFELIKKYSQIDESIGISKQCKIGVGYNTCKDISFKAVDLFKALSPEILKLGELKP